MRRKRAWKRGRVVSILLAGGVGYLLGGWHVATFHGTELSPAQTVALRFPEDPDDTAALGSALGAATNALSATGATSAMVLGDPQLALLSPAPMVPSVVPQPAPEAPVQPAAATAPSVALPAGQAKPAEPAAPAAPPTHRRPNRPAYVLNDTQIASIKQRLHLTPDQEAMWPAVEAALRNVAYARAREAHRRGAPASAAQLAATDPDSIEVQGLKSAAIPLLMTFSSEQKNEVRSLAHVMGLDKLASQL